MNHLPSGTRFLECLEGPLDGLLVSDEVPEPFLVVADGLQWTPAYLPYDRLRGATVHRYSRCLESHLHYQGPLPSISMTTRTGPHLGGA